MTNHNPDFSHQNRHVSSSMSKKLPSEDGLMMASSILSEIILDKNLAIEDTMSIPTIKIKTNNKMQEKTSLSMNQLMKTNLSEKSVTVELAVDTKKTILKDKSNLCKKNTQDTKSLKTSEVVSILNVQDYSESSIEQLMEISQKLWLPIKIDSVDSDMTFSNVSSLNVTSHSWFSITKIVNQLSKNYPKICSLSYTSSVVDLMEEENTKQEKIQTKKLRKTERKSIQFDTTKKPCKYIIKKNFNGKIYGRECGDITETESVNQFCIDHINKNENVKYDILTENTCEHIISQMSRGKDRKGMKCGKFTLDSTDKKYCTDHVKRHKDSENKNTETVERTIKIRYYPRSDEKKKLEKYYGCCRKIYNMLCDSEKGYNIEDEIDVNLMKNIIKRSYEISPNIMDPIEIKRKDEFTELRDKYVTYLGNKDGNEYMKDVPKEIRAFAVKEYITGKQNSKMQYKKKKAINEFCIKEYGKKYKPKKIKKSEMKYRKKKEEQSITINKDAITVENGNIYCYKKSFTEKPLILRNATKEKREKKYKEIIKNGIKHDIKIIKNKINKYYMCITYDTIKKKNEIDNKKVIAVDPGSTNFLTVYKENEILEIGRDNIKILEKLRKKIKELKKKRNGNEAKKLQIKLKNKVDDLHYKTITKLISENDLILIPKLNVGKIVRNKTLPTPVKRNILDLSHSRFMVRLKNKADIDKKIVLNVKESYTTQICSRCMNMNKVGNSKIYDCKKCGLRTGRDMNASKNILIKNIKEIKVEKMKEMPLEILKKKEKKSMKIE